MPKFVSFKDNENLPKKKKHHIYTLRNEFLSSDDQKFRIHQLLIYKLLAMTITQFIIIIIGLY